MIYHTIFHKARHYNKGGGVALYVNERIDCTLIESKAVVFGNMFECVTVELNMRKMKIVIVNCTYRTPGANVGDFCESVDNIRSRLSADFHSSIWRWARSICSCRLASVSGSFFSGGGGSYGNGRNEHVRHSLLYIPSVRSGVRRMCMLSHGAERGSRQADRALNRDLVYLSLWD